MDSSSGYIEYDPKRLADIIYKFLEEPLPKQERKELDRWIIQSEEHIELFEALTDSDYFQKEIEEF